MQEKKKININKSTYGVRLNASKKLWEDNIIG